jgi:hypothetical protein
MQLAEYYNVETPKSQVAGALTSIEGAAILQQSRWKFHLRKNANLQRLESTALWRYAASTELGDPQR